MSGNEPTRIPNVDGPPAGYFLVVPPASAEADADAIDMEKIAAVLRQYWKLLVCITFIGGVIGAGIGLSLRDVYKARLIVAPTAESNGEGGGLNKEIGGIAELAGIDLGGGGGRKVEALAVLNSKGFVREFINKNNLLPILFAPIWDLSTGTWRKGKNPPTMEMAVKRFMGRRTVDENSKSGLVTIDMVWYSPQIAAEWANGMIEMVNERMRATDIRTSEDSLDYLNRELANANGVELRMAVAHLIQTQENDKMVANVQRDYAYHYIDRAVAPETKSGPYRSLIAAAGGAVGFMLGVLIVVMRRRAALRRVASV